MNWKLGLFRIWITVSALWVVSVGWFINPVSTIQGVYAPIILRMGHDIIEFPRGTDTEILRHALTELARKEAAQGTPPVSNLTPALEATPSTPAGEAWGGLTPAPASALPYIESGVDATVNKAIGDYRPTSLAASLWSALYPVMGMIFLPPIALLLAGFTAVWIARGFFIRQ